jgi:peptide/nickel transport system ATP-binding protein
MSAAPILQVENLSVAFGSGPQAVRAVDAVSFALTSGQTMCLVGESGSGKSTVALAIMRLLTERARDMLDRVRIPDAARRLDSYPHELSGGMRQRVMIAMALCCNPKLLIADEPTTALDVTIQAQILALMQELKRELGTSMLLITHDLGVVAEMADEMAVMYAGRIVEKGTAAALFDRPAHAYTLGLLNSVPRREPGRRRARLTEIPGFVPRLDRPIDGCAFHQRCTYAVDQCRQQRPPDFTVASGHVSACWRYPDLAPSVDPQPKAVRRV